MTDPDIHSRLIGWLKIALPLLALAILSTLFLVARTVNPEDAIPYADVDVEDRLREPRMTAPTYAGLTQDGAALTVTADEARPATEASSASATSLTAVLETPDGARNELVAAAGQIDEQARKVVLSGGVTVTSSVGWSVQSAEMTAAMDVTDIQTPTAVTASGPAGKVTAKGMQLTYNPASPGQYLLVFNGDVKLIYQPPN